MQSPVGSWVDVPCGNSAATPSSRWESACAVYRDCLYLFGGSCGGFTRLKNLHEFNFSSKLWRVVPARGVVPSARYGHTCVVYKNALYMFGGYDGSSTLNELMEFNFPTQQWNAVIASAGTAPMQRHYHSSVVYGNSMYIFGGRYGDHNLNDFHEFNFQTRSWASVRATGEVPQARCHASLVVFESTAILFGGLNDSGYLNDLHAFDFGLRMWWTIVVDGIPPSPRYGHVAVVYSKAMYVFGGHARTRTNDFYKLSFGPSGRCTWEMVDPVGKPPRECYGHTAALYDSSLIVFGGQGNDNNFTQFRISDDRPFNQFGRSDDKTSAYNAGFKSSEESEDQVAKLDSKFTELREEVYELRAELEGNTEVTEHLRNELRDELNQLRLEIRQDADSLRSAILKESTKLCKRLMAETVTQLAELQGQAGAERSPVVRPVDPDLVELCSCPITLDIMKDPVLTPTGVTYERAMIEQHLDRVGPFDPTTKARLTKAELYPNRAIKNLIEKHFPNHVS